MAVGSISEMQANRQKYAKYFEDSNKNDMSMDTFYKLLTAEMSNQDPMEPMSNTEFISQMASFTSLKNQSDALYYSNANYAQGLVGKTVTIATVVGSEKFTDTGVVTSMNLLGGEFRVKVNGKDYAMSNIMEVLPTENPFTASSNDGAYATALIGKKVTLNATNADGAKIVEAGVVQHIEIKDNEISVVVGGVSFPLSSVVKIENADAAKSDENSGSEDGADTSTSETSGTSSTSKSGGTGETDEASETDETEKASGTASEEITEETTPSETTPLETPNEQNTGNSAENNDTAELYSMFGAPEKGDLS